jgi:hypothetical protein
MNTLQTSRRLVLWAIALPLVLAADGCSTSTSPENGGGKQGSGGKTGTGGATGSGGVGQGGSSSTKAASGGSGAGGINGNGGVQGGGGGNSGAAGSCTNATACGGDVTGTWTVTSSCLRVSGDMDLSLVGAGCPSAPVTGSLEVSGTLTITADGKFTDKTITTGNEKFTLGPSCLVISSTPVNCDGAANLLASVLGYTSLKCTSLAAGGCDCSGVVRQEGELAVLSMNPSVSGKSAVAGNVLTMSGDSDDTPYGYCVAGTKLTMVPKVTSPTMTGSIVLQRGDSPGAGGSGPGSGGNKGSGGAPGAGGASGIDAGTGSGGSAGGNAPCDLYAAANTPCVAAHSVVRALYSTYTKPLYQVRRTDNTTKDILPLAPGGIADTAPEDTFCAGSTCVLTVIYDQTGKGNDLWYQGSEQVPASKSSSPAKATTDAVNVGGHKVYSVYINPGNCYWHDGSKSGMPTGAQPEGMYMVTSSRHANAGCCFDYGNSETDRSADGAGAMDSLNFSTTTAWGSGAGNGPWIMADLEYGLFAQGDNKKNANAPTQTAAFVTAVLKNNGTTEYALKGADATTGSLSTYYKGALPGGWSPMKKQGALILGCGGDCCKPSGGANASSGIFFEGAIVSGYPTDATENAIQANIVAAGYGK